MRFKSRRLKKYSILPVMLPLMMAHFTEAADEGTWLINPTIGYQRFDDDRYLGNDSLIGLGIEYHYNNPWGVELKYFVSDLEGENGNPDADLEQLMLEGIYKLDKLGNLEPYLAAGLGHADFDYDGGDSHEETQATAGIGMRYWFNRHWSAKTDLRMVRGIDDGHNDQLITLAISYAFGRGSTPKQMQAEPTPVVEVAPVAVRELPKDTDGDGVVDGVDQCPNTPANKAVDDNGCAKKIIQNKTISLNIQFAYDDDRVTDSHLPEIEKIAHFMQRYSTVTGTIEGHSDSIGTSAYNKKLSQRRANAVRQVLIERFGIEPERLDAVGYGEEQPIADNSTAAGRQLNRRVVAAFIAEVIQ